MRQSRPSARQTRASWLPWPFREPKEADRALPDNLALAGSSEQQQGHVVGSEELQPLGRLCGGPQRDHGGNAVGELNERPFERGSGRLSGLQDGEVGGSPSIVTYHVVGDTVVGCLPGYQPSPTAEQHAREFVAYLQRKEPFPGRWVPAHLLQEYEYPSFIESMGWQPQSWITVARYIYDLGLMTRRKNDRRSGPHRRGSCRTEYLVPSLPTL